MAKESAYARAGVDIEAGNKAVELMQQAVRSTYGPEVLLGIGAFGGLFDVSRLKAMKKPVLVGSTDSVGTKIMVAAAIGSYETLGHDIVNHCVNDILVQGAEPLFFLDYVAAPHIDPVVIARVVSGVAKACRAAGCALLGGETAELPGMYAPGQMDLVGAIVGLVDGPQIIDGSRIAPGDVLLGLPSSGLHTNGFTLVRSIFGPDQYGAYTEVLGRPLAQELCEPHRSYLTHFRKIRAVADIKGMAHITGGGFWDNIPRILPQGVCAIIQRNSWPMPPIFSLLQRQGQVDDDEMYRVFNMGIGLVLVIPSTDVDAARRAVSGEAYVIGEITEQREKQRVVLQ